MYSEDNYLMLSGLQHFVFCRRQWALIHIEQQWADNFRTADGEIMHKNVHNPDFREVRGDVITVRAMAVSSSRLGISGECDAVEFRKDSSGVALSGLEGRYSVTPVEYKRGSPKEDERDTVQLAAQAMCLEEMLCCTVPCGYLYYGETRHRTKVVIDGELRRRVEAAAKEMHEMFDRSYTPKVRRTKSCNACSLKELCLPQLGSAKNAGAYVKRMLGSEE